jgi:hypothetical protein
LATLEPDTSSSRFYRPRRLHEGELLIHLKPALEIGQAKVVGRRKLSFETASWFLDAFEPVMEQLHVWLESQFAEKKTEPNSGLGKAITYLLRHWKGLTAFLRHAGAPLDNNICEQALKRAVLVGRGRREH